MIILKATEMDMMDIGSTRVSLVVSRVCAELYIWRPTKECLHTREDVFLSQGNFLYRVLAMLLCMDSHFLPDS